MRISSESQGETYVACLDCGQQFAYDWENMRLGKPVDVSNRSQGFTRVKMATRSRIYPGIRLQERRAFMCRRAEDVDRLLDDQLDSHLSPLRTGIGSRSFRLRAVRTGDGDRRSYLPCARSGQHARVVDDGGMARVGELQRERSVLSRQEVDVDIEVRTASRRPRSICEPGSVDQRGRSVFFRGLGCALLTTGWEEMFGSPGDLENPPDS